MGGDDDEKTDITRTRWYAPLRAVGESTRYVVSGAVAATLLSQRDVATVLWVLGAIVAAVANKALKRTIKQARPGKSNEDDGMPSSHACAMTNLGTTALCFVWETDPASTSFKLGVTLSLGAYWLLSLTWRVVSRYHTVAQIIVGAAFGALTSLAWRYVVVDAAGLGAFAERLASDGRLDVGLLGSTVLLFGALVVGFRDLKKLVLPRLSASSSFFRNVSSF